MYERNRKSFNNQGFTRRDSIEHFRERTPPWPRSQIMNDHRFERPSLEEFIRRTVDRSEARFERAHLGERFEPPRQLIDEAGRFGSPPHDGIDEPRSFKNERYVPPSSRFEERIEAAEAPKVKRNLSVEFPADFPMFPVDGGYYEARNINNVNISPRPLLESATMYAAGQIEDNDKPDPWDICSIPSSSSQQQLIFGHEKGNGLIPVFDPETSVLTVGAFLNLIDKIGQAKSWSGDYRKSQFAVKLQGPAKEWFLNAANFLDSWSSIKNQFRNAFPADMDFYTFLTDMIQRVKQPDEDLSTYFNYKIVLLNKCNITGRKAISCLIGGLPDTMAEVKTNALDKNFATAEELYKYLIDEHVEDKESQIPANMSPSLGIKPLPSPAMPASLAKPPRNNPGAWVRQTDHPPKKKRKRKYRDRPIKGQHRRKVRVNVSARYLEAFYRPGEWKGISVKCAE